MALLDAFDADVLIYAVQPVHLATAVLAGADRFVTNNGRDVPQAISEIDVTYPDEL